MALGRTKVGGDEEVEVVEVSGESERGTFSGEGGEGEGVASSEEGEGGQSGGAEEEKAEEGGDAGGNGEGEKSRLS